MFVHCVHIEKYGEPSNRDKTNCAAFLGMGGADKGTYKVNTLIKSIERNTGFEVQLAKHGQLLLDAVRPPV